MTLASGSGGVNYNTFTAGGMGSGMGYPEGEEENNEEEEKPWYLDHDNDGYHSEIRISKDKPLGGNWISTTNGEDCDDLESSLTTDCSCETKCLLVKSDKTGKSKLTKRTAKDIDVSDCECEEDDDEEEDFRVFNELTTPCLLDIYNQIGVGKFNEYLQSFEPDFSVADLKLSEDRDFSNNEEEKYHSALAITKPPISSNLIEIKFNTDPNLEGSNILNQPDVVKTVAFIHEMLHAEMYRKMLDAVKATEINQNNLKWDTWPNDTDFDDFVESLENKYFGIFDFYTRFEWDTPTPNDPQHQLIADRYRDVIKEVLNDYDPTLTENQKEALSWIGLDEANIVAWQLLLPEEREIINDLQREILNTFSNECN